MVSVSGRLDPPPNPLPGGGVCSGSQIADFRHRPTYSSQSRYTQGIGLRSKRNRGSLHTLSVISYQMSLPKLQQSWII